MNKAAIIGLLLLLLVVLGFGAEEKAAELLAEQATEVQASTEVTEKPVVSKEVEVPFDTNFTLKPGESICVGQSDILLELLDYTYEDEMIWFSYQLTIGDKVFAGTGGGSDEVGCTITQEEFTKNRILFVSADTTKGITMQMTADTVVASPLVLSGDGADEYVTTKPEYIVAEDFILFLDKDMKVKGDVMEQIAQIFQMVEQETGLQFKNDSRFASYTGNDDQWLYDNAFAGVDPKREKFHIYAVADEKCSPCSLTKAIVINQMDLDIAAGEGMAIVHELVHSVHAANGVQMNSIMDEGYATYITGQITEKSKDIPFHFDADVNYGYYDVVITPENAEDEFLKEYDDTWNYYLYGYRFVTFLHETYGEDVFLNILSDATGNAGEYDVMISNADVIPIIKENTSDAVFEEFAKWLSANQDRFTTQ